MSCLRVFNNLARTALGLVLLLLQLVALSAAEILALTCEVLVLPSGRFQYQLSSAVGVDCDPSWEDANKTVITWGSKVNQTLVQDLTDLSLTLYQCLDYAHFMAQCTSFVEAYCFFNCSSVLDLAPTTSPVAADPQNLDLDQSSVITIISVVLLVVLLAVGLIVWYLVPKCKRRRGQYTPGRAEVSPGTEMVEYGPTQVITA